MKDFSKKVKRRIVVDRSKKNAQMRDRTTDLVITNDMLLGGMEISKGFRGGRG